MTTGVAAPGVEVARWVGREVALAEVARQLARLRQPEPTGEPCALASVLTLVGFAPDPDEARAMEEVLSGLADHQPSRTLVVSHEPGPGPLAIDARIESAAHPAHGERCVRVELVRLETRGGSPEAAASTVVPFLRFDLPTYLWWPSAPEPEAHPLLGPLARLADRLVSEGERLGDAVRALALLGRQMGGEARPAAALSDLAWAAITPWRQLLAQLVDAEALAGLQAGGARVTIAHEGPAPGLRPLLLAGWLRDVVGDGLAVELRPGEAAEPPGPITGIELSGRTGRSLCVERPRGRDAAEVVVRSPDGDSRRRVLPLPRGTRAALLAGELELLRPDRSFERALPRAARIAKGDVRA